MKEPVLAGDALSKYCAHSAEARSCFMQAGGLFMIQAALRSPHEANVAAALVVAAALAAAEDGAAMMAAPRRGQAPGPISAAEEDAGAGTGETFPKMFLCRAEDGFPEVCGRAEGPLPPADRRPIHTSMGQRHRLLQP
eukprot:CAMPEP_0177620274 /NCGR_PEP_ID=MMETSP0419_2-20121207/26791_1 /TAXON_ID=582737 /ORGANISM="Tetraselmis sp., Strain GSL018" /LENGTH=137 /DNA_ID=CAMNT_0019119767 /DNA_START=346 /DNA_END=759 /DNA_ORIENTATION=-